VAIANMNQAVIDQAYEHWMADNRPLELGRVLYDNLTLEQRPLWAASILRLAYTRTRIVPEIDQLLKVAEDPTRWHEALQSLDSLRGITIVDKNVLHHEIVDMAQKVAKITHNTSGQPDPFPDDIGYRLIVDLHQIVGLVDNDAFTSHVWDKLIAPFID
jgi:hypothetical protein